VIARTSAFAFEGKQEDIRKIAEVLGVANILEGSVWKSGNRIRVTAQLIDASKGGHLWSERYDREMRDVFAIQDEISQSIAEKLRIQFSGDRPLIRKTENIEAYNLNLKGRYYLFKLTPDSLAKSKECFEQAIAMDPNYAPPWHGLAAFYSTSVSIPIAALCRGNCFCRAPPFVGDTDSTVIAFLRIYLHRIEVQSILFGYLFNYDDGLFRAFINADATLEASLGINFICHAKLL
jgi:hypothetical protein